MPKKKSHLVRLQLKMPQPVAPKRMTPVNQDNIGNRSSSSPQGQETVKAFAALFRGRVDVRGELYDESNPDDPKYSTKIEPVTLGAVSQRLVKRIMQVLNIHFSQLRPILLTFKVH